MDMLAAAAAINGDEWESLSTNGSSHALKWTRFGPRSSGAAAAGPRASSPGAATSEQARLSTPSETQVLSTIDEHESVEVRKRKDDILCMLRQHKKLRSDSDRSWSGTAIELSELEEEDAPKFGLPKRVGSLIKSHKENVNQGSSVRVSHCRSQRYVRAANELYS